MKTRRRFFLVRKGWRWWNTWDEKRKKLLTLLLLWMIPLRLCSFLANMTEISSHSSLSHQRWLGSLSMSFCDSVSTRWNDTTSKLVSSSFKSFFPSKQSNKKQPNTWKWVIRFKSNDFSSWLVLHFSLTVSLSAWRREKRERERDRETERWQKKKGITQKVLSGRITKQGRKRQDERKTTILFGLKHFLRLKRRGEEKREKNEMDTGLWDDEEDWRECLAVWSVSTVLLTVVSLLQSSSSFLLLLASNLFVLNAFPLLVRLAVFDVEMSHWVFLSSSLTVIWLPILCLPSVSLLSSLFFPSLPLLVVVLDDFTVSQYSLLRFWTNICKGEASKERKSEKTSRNETRK